jgi:LuxR family maltose regulon positive regulatory protein
VSAARTRTVTTRHAPRQASGRPSDAEAPSRFQPSFPLVEAKFHAPAPRPGTIPRDRLIRLLTAEPRSSVVSVIAPPGYGKTLLLAEWAAGEGRPVAWLTLDDFDNVPSVFLTYLAAAIDRIQSIDPSIRSAIAAHETRILATAVPRLAFELHRIGRPALLVLDDVHRLVDPTCLDALSALLDHLPPEFQVAMAGRSLPDLPFGRFRVERDLLEIGRDELALDLIETEALTSAAGHSLDSGQIRALAERTEGWAAGIYLATLGGGRSYLSASASDGVSSQSGYVADYLRSELLPGLAVDDVTFLTRSSILDVVEPQVAELVAGLPGAGARLRSLARVNQLIGEVGGAGGGYRYHNLLREFLRAELDRREPGMVPELHRRAAWWYAAADRTEPAVEHALQGGDIDVAADLVTAGFLRALYGGHADKLDRWLRGIDDAALSRHPPLAVLGAWNHLLNGRPEAAEHLADIAERSTFSGDPGTGAASFESSRALLRAVMTRHGPEDMLANASFAVSAEGPGSPWRTNALLMLGSAHLLLGDDAEADAAFADAVEAGAMAGAMVAWANRASLAITRGDWGAAEHYARESHGVLARAHLGNLSASLMTHAVAARVAIHRGAPARAREELVRAQLVCPLANHAQPSFAVGALLELALAYLAIADPSGARNVVSHAEAIVRRRPALGMLNPSLAEMRERLRDATSVLAGSSALSTAELRLLPILSTPLTFKEIGERMFLSRHTVKTQAISIYGKLGASSRSDAVQRAIELGLLEPFPGPVPVRRPSTG